MLNVIERNKNMILNVGVVILAVIIALQFWHSSSTQVSALIKEQNDALEKNKITQEISGLEKQAAAYKNVFVRKDLASVMDTVSAIAKNASVKILSVKPFAEESMDNYFNASFIITLHAPSYHALGDFISKIENDKDVYLVSDININAVTNADPKAENAELDVSLKINTISYL